MAAQAAAQAAETYEHECTCEEEMRAKTRPDLVIEGGPMEGLLECKGITTCPTRYKGGWGPRSAGWTPVERRAAAEMNDRMKAVAAIDQEQHPRVRPPPLRKRVDQLGGLRVAVVGGFCEYNDAVHELVQAAAEAIAARNRSRSGGTYRQRRQPRGRGGRQQQRRQQQRRRRRRRLTEGRRRRRRRRVGGQEGGRTG